MTVFFGFDPCVTIYYEILFRKSEILRTKYRARFFMKREIFSIISNIVIKYPVKN